MHCRRSESIKDARREIGRKRELGENTWKKLYSIEHPHRTARFASLVRGAGSDKETFIYFGKAYMFALLFFVFFPSEDKVGAAAVTFRVTPIGRYQEEVRKNSM